MALTKLNKKSSSDGILTDVEINTGTLAGTHILGYNTATGAWVNADPSVWFISKQAQTISNITWSSASKSLSISHADASFDSLSLTDVAIEDADVTFGDITCEGSFSVSNSVYTHMTVGSGKTRIHNDLQVDGIVTATTFRQVDTGTNAFSLGSNGRITTGENLVVTGELTFDGGSSTNHLSFPDDKEVRFGTNALRLYHDGSFSRITDNSSNPLLISGSGVWLNDYSTGEDYLRSTPNGAVQLYYDGAEKIKTTSAGVDVTGRIDLDDANVQLKQAGTQLRVQTPSGWGGFGPQNTGFCHITTDRSKFYMSEPLQVDGTISIYNGNVSLGGSGTIGAATWANGQFHLGTSSLGWAMDPNEFYNSGSANIGTITGDLNLNPKAGYITTGRPFVSTSYITADGGGSANWNTAYGWGNHASAGYLTAIPAADAPVRSSELPNTTNLDTLGQNADAGFYHQESNAQTSGNNYPVNLAGSLLVQKSANNGGYGTTQLYITYNNADMYVRPMYGSSSANNAWHQVWTSRNITTTKISNWDTAYGWGNHAFAGYYSSSNPAGKVSVTTASNSWYDILGHSGGTVYADTACEIHGSGYIRASYFNMTHSVSTRNSDTVFFTSSDSYIRKNNAGGTRTSLSVYSKAESDAKYVRTDANTDVSAHIEMQDNYEMRFGTSADVRMDFNGTDFTCRSYNHGARLLFQGERTSDGSNRALLYLDPDGEASIHHSGSKKGYTYSSGWRVTGNMLATSNVYAYYSDERLKDVVGKIDAPLEKIKAIDTFYYTHNDTARDLGYEGSERQVGVSAQSVQAVMPEVIGRAPIDDDGEGGSVTGEDYMTVQYERLVPLLIESIKTLTDQVESLGKKVKELEG